MSQIPAERWRSSLGPKVASHSDGCGTPPRAGPAPFFGPDAGAKRGPAGNRGPYFNEGIARLLWGKMWGRQNYRAEMSRVYNRLAGLIGGGGGIRTHGTRKGTPVFETGPFDHSGTPPNRALHMEGRGATQAPG